MGTVLVSGGSGRARRVEMAAVVLEVGGVACSSPARLSIFWMRVKENAQRVESTTRNTISLSIAIN